MEMGMFPRSALPVCVRLGYMGWKVRTFGDLLCWYESTVRTVQVGECVLVMIKNTLTLYESTV